MKEKDFLSSISFVLRFGVILFIALSLISYAIKPFNRSISHILLSYASFMLIITPLVRVVMLIFGFYSIKDYKYFLYSILVFVIIVFGVII